MLKTGYKAIIFDLGGVLIDIDYQATERAFIELGVEDFAHQSVDGADQCGGQDQPDDVAVDPRIETINNV